MFASVLHDYTTWQKFVFGLQYRLSNIFCLEIPEVLENLWKISTRQTEIRLEISNVRPLFQPLSLLKKWNILLSLVSWNSESSSCSRIALLELKTKKKIPKKMTQTLISIICKPWSRRWIFQLLLGCPTTNFGPLSRG